MASLRCLLDLLGRDPRSSLEIQQALGASQPTVSRLLRKAGEQVVRIGGGRSTRYALGAPTFGSTGGVSIFAVNERGMVVELCRLRALSGGGYYVDGAVEHWWLRGYGGDGVFESIPYFLDDLRPSGFLGRQLARRLSADGTYPSDPRNWTDEHIGRYLLAHADDLPGSLVIGEAAAKRVNHAIVNPDVDDRQASYPELATRALEDDAPGSSAAGEQPKFAIYRRDTGHVIVKFSPSGRSREARRWQDLLRTEFHAQSVLSEHGIPAAKAELFEFDGRVFLESRRFDRVGAKGRRPAISLTMVDAEFAGEALGWSRVAHVLWNERMLDAASVEHIAWAETFGTWIGNSDMHLGNVSLTPTDECFELLPIYDMLPMAYAPTRGESPIPRLSPPIITDANRSVWAASASAALVFWERVCDDPSMSRDFRRVGKQQCARIADALESER